MIKEESGGPPSARRFVTLRASANSVMRKLEVNGSAAADGLGRSRSCVTGRAGARFSLLQRELYQLVDKAGIGDAGGLHHARIHADVREAWNRVDFVENPLSIVAEEEVDTGHAAAFHDFECFDGNGADGVLPQEPDAIRTERQSHR